MALWETRVEIAPGDAEAAQDALMETGCDGWTLIEDAVARRAWIVGIFKDAEEGAARWRELLPALPAPPAGPLSGRVLPDEDWKDSYKQHFRAWTFGRLHWVPLWERGTFRPLDGHSVLWLDPGLAFGTGNHETTRLCIERLVEFESAQRAGGGALRMADAGCGSGILALSAALLGFGRVYGFDNDPEAVRVSLENARLNGLSDRVRFATAGLPDGFAGATYDVVAANIQADVLTRHRAALAAAIAPGGMLAMSGILAAESAAVRDAFGPLTRGWASDSRVLGEWSDLCLRRPAP